MHPSRLCDTLGNTLSPHQHEPEPDPEHHQATCSRLGSRRDRPGPGFTEVCAVCEVTAAIDLHIRCVQDSAVRYRCVVTSCAEIVEPPHGGVRIRNYVPGRDSPACPRGNIEELVGCSQVSDGYFSTI